MVFNPAKKMVITWKEFCRMKEAEHDEVMAEIEKRKKEKANASKTS